MENNCPEDTENDVKHQLKKDFTVYCSTASKLFYISCCVVNSFIQNTIKILLNAHNWSRIKIQESKYTSANIDYDYGFVFIFISLHQRKHNVELQVRGVHFTIFTQPEKGVQPNASTSLALGVSEFQYEYSARTNNPLWSIFRMNFPKNLPFYR